MIAKVAKEIRERIEQDLFARSLGIELLELAPGFANCAMTVRAEMVNFHGTAHGGVIFSLADAAFAAACNASGQTAVALATLAPHCAAHGLQCRCDDQLSRRGKTWDAADCTSPGRKRARASRCII